MSDVIRILAEDQSVQLLSAAQKLGIATVVFLIAGIWWMWRRL